jgi:hypothetical protein
VGGTLRAPRLLVRETIELLGDPDRFVYHRAAEMDLAQAKKIVAQAKQAAEKAAALELARLVEHARAAEADLAHCAIVANPAASRWTLEEILAAHPRIHTAEGFLYRDALVSAASELQLEVSVVAPKELASSESLPLIAAMKKEVGPPWGKDQRFAALAAWTALRAGS